MTVPDFTKAALCVSDYDPAPRLLMASFPGLGPKCSSPAHDLCKHLSADATGVLITLEDGVLSFHFRNLFPPIGIFKPYTSNQLADGSQGEGH